MKLLLGILFGAAILIVYVLIEKRRSQRACPVCGYQVSLEATNEPCPRCDALINPAHTA